MKREFVLSFIIMNGLLFLSCGNADRAQGSNMHKIQQCKKYSKIEGSEERVGRNVGFEILKNGPEKFKITNIDYYDRSIEKKTHPDLNITSNEEIFLPLKEIFSGNCDISFEIPKSREGLDGDNWHNLRLYNTDGNFEKFSEALKFILKDKKILNSVTIRDYVWKVVFPQL